MLQLLGGDAFAVGGDLVELPTHGPEVATGAAQQQIGATGRQPETARRQLGVQPLAALRGTQLRVVHDLAPAGLDGCEDRVSGSHGGADGKADVCGGGTHRQCSGQLIDAGGAAPRPAELRQIADEHVPLTREERHVDEARDQRLQPRGRIDDLEVVGGHGAAPTQHARVDKVRLVAVDEQESGTIAHRAIVCGGEGRASAGLELVALLGCDH